jgi:serine/threonine protein kinase
MQQSIIKDYIIQRELGQGGMAKVYLAHDNKFDTNVAIKILNKEFVFNENIRKRFLAEAKSMFKMSHPNIIKVNDLIEEGDTVAFVMEYIEGDTLKDYLERKGKLSNEEIKDLFTQILNAVAYVHEQYLVHRDIKPSNFMIDKKGTVKLLDFGIAKNLNPDSAEYTMTEQHQIMGTVMYMSPEQIKSTKQVTFAADIYSLGVVLWQMVTGQKPYDTKTLSTFQLQSKIVNEKLALTHTIWDNCIQKACAKNREERYQNCNAWLAEMSQTTSSNSTNRTNDDKTVISSKIYNNTKENNASDKTTFETQNVKTKVTSYTTYNPQKKNNNGIIIGFVAGLILLIIILFLKSESSSPSREELTAEEMSISYPIDTIALSDSLAAAAFADSLRAVEKTNSSGNYVFWFDADINGKWVGNIKIYINDEYVGTINNWFNENPGCYSDGCVTISRPPGTYLFNAYADDGTLLDTDYITITENNCNNYRLYVN